MDQVDLGGFCGAMYGDVVCIRQDRGVVTPRCSTVLYIPPDHGYQRPIEPLDFPRIFWMVRRIGRVPDPEDMTDASKEARVKLRTIIC